MKPVQTTFLFCDARPIELQPLGQQISDCLSDAGIEGIVQAETEDDDCLTFTSDGFRLALTATPAPLPVEAFDRSLDSIVSEAQRDALAKILFDHKRCMTIVLTPTPGEGVFLAPSSRLRMLEAAHAMCAVVADLLLPEAIHWLHSDQLLTREQFERIAAEASPIALFAPGFRSGQTVRISPPDDLSPRDIIVNGQANNPNLAYATGLAFLRHMVETGAPLPDGDSYGPVREHQIQVRHVDMAPPDGRQAYHLTMKAMHDFIEDRLNPGNARALATIQTRLRDMAGKTGRPISKAIFSTMM